MRRAFVCSVFCPDVHGDGSVLSFPDKQMGFSKILSVKPLVNDQITDSVTKDQTALLPGNRVMAIGIPQRP